MVGDYRRDLKGEGNTWLSPVRFIMLESKTP